MIITKLCIILVIFAKHCDPLAPYLPAVGLQFTTAGHAMYLELFKWPNDERSQLETERPKIRKSRKKPPAPLARRLRRLVVFWCDWTLSAWQ